MGIFNGVFQLPGCSGAWLGSNYSPEPAASFVHLYSLGHNANLRNPFAGVQCSEFRVYLSQDKNRQKSNGAAAGLHDGEDKVQVPTTEGGDTLARNELGGSGRIPRSRINTLVAFTVTPCAGSLARTDSWWAFSCFELGMWCILFIWFTAFRWENTGISVKVRCKREVLCIKIWKTLFPFSLRHIDCKKVCNEL